MRKLYEALPLLSLFGYGYCTLDTPKNHHQRGTPVGKYVDLNLISGEEIQFEGKTSIWSLSPKIILGVILLPFFGLGLLFLVSAAITYYTTELAVTNRRIIAKFGLIARSTIEMDLTKVETLRVDQSILGRIFKFGSITVNGAGNPQTPIPGINSPMQFRKSFLEFQDSLGNKEHQQNIRSVVTEPA